MKKINLLDLLDVVRKPKTSRAKRKRKQGKGKDGNNFKALKCFISLKNESERIGRTEKNRFLFSSEKNQNSNHFTQKKNTSKK